MTKFLLAIMLALLALCLGVIVYFTAWPREPHGRVDLTNTDPRKGLVKDGEEYKRCTGTTLVTVLNGKATKIKDHEECR